jgi:GH25 family lysozyme M1 (1,4-beta-N-acetylmuramidase)
MHPRHETAPATVPQDSTVRSAATPKGLVPGVDVSAYQPHVNWTSVNAEGARFAYVKATEGVKYKSSTFTAQYTGARNAGLAHGAYHFATPNTASGIAQADYFVAHGCYGMSHAKMNSWITAFLHEHRARTGRHAVINTFRDWWIACTGNAGAKSGSTFGATYLLWVNEHKASAANVPVPSAWKSYTVWQWTDSHSPSENVYALDTDLFCARRRSHTCGHFSRYRGDLHPIGRTLAIKGKSIFEQRVRGSAPIDRLRGIWAVRGALHSARSRPDRRDRAAGCPAVSGISVADSVERNRPYQNFASPYQAGYAAGGCTCMELLLVRAALGGEQGVRLLAGLLPTKTSPISRSHSGASQRTDSGVNAHGTCRVYLACRLTRLPRHRLPRQGGFFVRGVCGSWSQG